MIYHGVCYYPEHWTAEQAKEHIPLMKKAGINVVRLAEFAWARIEPEPGRYRFTWLDEAIAAFRAAGIATVLGTPTAIPPQWALVRHPHILQVTADGRTRNPGARCHACKNAPEFQILAEQITQEMARHYATMDGVIGWQTDNEFGCHGTTRCYCPHCEKAFRDWLLEKYGDTDAVNAAWGTAFWGFEFRQWNEIPLPRQMPTGPNPGHWLDFARFSSDTQIKFHKTQFDLLKSLCPKHFVTHNLMGRFPEIDYYKLAQHLDMPTWDNYPAGADPYAVAYAHAITRSLRGRFWVMEQQSGPTGDSLNGLLGEQPEQGDIRRWTWQAIANGANGVSYFRWRPCLTGAEQYWHGILDHDGVPRRRYAEVMRTGEEIQKLREPLKGTHISTVIGLIRSFDCLWSLERQPGAPGFNYDDHCLQFYRAIQQQGHACNVIGPETDFTGYKFLFAPTLTIVSPEDAAKLDTFVQAGGTLVLTPQSGARTPSNAMSDRTRPGLLAPMAGITVEEVRAYHSGQTEQVRFAEGPLAETPCSVGTWVERLKPASAQPLAVYGPGPLEGKAAITVNSHGQGKVYYIGALLPRETLDTLIGSLLPDFAIKAIPEGVEVTTRRSKDRRLLFLINHTRERKMVQLPGAFPELLSGETVGPEVPLGGNGVLVFQV